MAYTETKYVNVNKGSDTLGDGSKELPYATIEYCISKLTTSEPLIYIEEGIYPVSYLHKMSLANKKITFKGKNKKTIIEIQQVASAQWLGDAIISNCVIRPSNSFSGDTRALSYTSDNKNIVYYNVCFTKSLNQAYPTTTFFFTYTSGAGYTYKDYYNCSFIGNILTIGAGGGKLNNCAIMYGSVYGGTLTNTKLNCLFDSRFNIIDSDGNKINNDIYGVYSGDLAWGQKILIKYNNEYYSIHTNFYNIDTKQFTPLDSIDFDNYGFELSDLYQDIYIGKETTDITPIMTSNTTPSPYVVTASSQYNTDTYLPWKAFNGTNINGLDCWVTGSSIKNGWIMIDLNVPVTINGFRITCRYGYTTCAPQDFTLEGSNDGTDFVTLKAVRGESQWSAGETKSYTLANNATYRYYRLSITSINSGDYVAIGGLRFLNTVALIEKFTPIDKFNNFKLIIEDSDKDTNIAIRGVKYDKQLVVASDDIHSSIAFNIDYFKLTSTVTDNADLRIALSIDKGQTWKVWDSINNSYIDLSDISIPLKPYSTLSDIELTQWNLATESIAKKGITTEIFNSLDFNQLNSETIRFAYVLIRPSYSDNAETSQLDWQFDSKGNMRKILDSECVVDVFEKRIKFTPLIDNPLIKVNVMG